jgi:glycosyltransferase involved in cell wall biosynthesis
VRILHVVARSHTRGAELVAIELAEELELLGHDNRLVTLGLSHGGGQEPHMPPLVKRAGTTPDVLALASFRLRRQLRRQPADVVVAHGGWCARVTAAAVPRGGPLLVWQRILGFPPAVWRPAHRRWWRIVLRRVDAAVALTTELADELRLLGFDRPIWLIPNSRRPARFEGLDRAEERAALHADVGLPADRPILGFVGHLVDQKRPERAVDVLLEVRRRGVPAHLVIAGDGPRRGVAEARARELDLSAHVSFLGHRADVERVFAGMDLCLLTSEAEGIPGVAIEAQMAGTPVISYPLGGVAEVVEHGVTGIVLDEPRIDPMAEAAVALLLDPARRDAMGEAARDRTPLFSAARTAALYAERLEELVRTAGTH